MDKLSTVERALEQIRLEEGEGFQMDREKILDRYRDDQRETTSLAIKILSVAGGLLATLAFAGFLGVLDLFESRWALLVLGPILLGLSLGIQRIFKTLILDSLGISLYVLGMVLTLMGLWKFNLTGNSLALAMLLLALATLALSRSPLLSFCSVLTVASTLLHLILENDLPDLIHLYVACFSLALAHGMLKEEKYRCAPPFIGERYGPLRIGLTFALLIGLAALGIGDLVPLTKNWRWISALVPLALILYLVPSISKTLGATKKGGTTAFVLTALSLLPTLFAPAIAGALLLTLLSFKVKYPTGLGLGIIALVYFVIQYYYDLNLTLLTKSILLFTSGILFLLFHLFFTKGTKDEKI